MSITYGIIEEIYSLNGAVRLSYGLAVYADAALNGTSTVVASAHDVSSDKDRLLKRIRQFNRLQLSLIHWDDILEDLLTD